MTYRDPKQKLAPRRAKKGTPALGGGFGGKEALKWVEKEIKVRPKAKCDCSDIWDHLHASIRKGKPFPIKLEEAMQVMEILSKARKGTSFEFKK